MPYKPVPHDNEVLDDLLSDPEALAIYEATKLQIDLALQLKNARIKRKMTQEDVASILHTKKPAISRLETSHENVKNFPSLLTLVKFASAIGYELKIGLVPLNDSAK